MDIPQSGKLGIIIPAYRMHSQTFLNALEGISDTDALRRIDNNTNHIVWMAGNFVNMRYGLGWILGLREEDPYSDLFFQGKAIDETFNYPTLQQLTGSFHKISPLVYDRLLKVTDEELNEPFKTGMNISFYKENKLNFIGMCTGRADYLCGQIGLMRKILGYPGMKYDINETITY